MNYLSHRLSAAMWARVQVLWLTLGIAALLFGGVAIGMGMYIRDNVRDELAAQQITFPPEDALSDAERAIDGIVENAGEQMTTGDQARVYSDYILLHMNESAEEAGYPGATYATLGATQRQYRAEVAAAREAGDQAALDEAQARLDAVTQLRNTMLTGSNLRANLLSAYGWDNVGLGVIVLGAAIIVLSLIFFLLLFFERRRGHLPPTEPA